MTGGAQVTSGGVLLSTVNANNSASSVVVDGPGSRWTNTGAFDVSVGFVAPPGPGVLTVSNGVVVSSTGAMHVGALGRVNGNGTIIANVVNEGVFAPGLSPGVLQIQGDYQQLAGGALELEMAGTAPGLFDQLVVAGDVSLQGQLALKFLDGYLPRAGDQFDLVSVVGGTFTSAANITFSGVAAGWQFNQQFDGDSAKLILTSLNDAQPAPGTGGDFNGDGSVDGADLNNWATGFGTGTTHTQGDADGDLDVDGGDFLTWQRQLGSAVTMAATAAIPEPTTLVMLIVAAAASISWRCRRIT